MGAADNTPVFNMGYNPKPIKLPSPKTTGGKLSLVKAPAGMHPTGTPATPVQPGNNSGGGFLSGLESVAGGVAHVAGQGLHYAYGVPLGELNKVQPVHWATSKAALAAHDVAAMGVGGVKALNQIVNPNHSGVDFLHGLVDTLGGPFAITYDKLMGKNYDANRPNQRLAHWFQGGYGQPTWTDWKNEWAGLNHPIREYQDSLKGKYGPGQKGDAGLIGGTLNSYKTVAEHPLRDPFMTALSVLPAASAFTKLGIGARAGMLGEDAATLGKTRFINAPKISKGKIKTSPVQLTAAEDPLARGLQHLHDKLIEKSLTKRKQEVIAGTAGEKASRLARYGEKRIGWATDETSRRGDQTSGALPTMLDRIAMTRRFGGGLSKAEGNLALMLRSSGVLPHEFRDFMNNAVMDAKEGHHSLIQHWADTADTLHKKEVLSLNKGEVTINPAFDKLQKADTWVRKGQDAREGVISRNQLLGDNTDTLMHERLNLVAQKILGDKLAEGRGGKGFFTLKPSEKDLPKYPRTANNRFMGGIKKFTNTKKATGKGIAQGILPVNMVHSVAHTTREALQFENKLRYRLLLGKHTSDVKTARDDVLMSTAGAKNARALKKSEKIAAGLERSVVTDPLEHAATKAAMERIRNEHFPFRSGTHELDWYKNESVGTKAPPGYAWVPRRYLGGAADTTAAKGGIQKTFDNVNQAVTAATVYFKLSHIPQRAITDLTTSATSGSMFSRKSLRAAFALRDKLGPEEFNRANSATGTHGYTALPHGDGPLNLQNKVGRLATRGSSFYARTFDAPVRWLNLVHEARRAGIIDDGMSLSKQAEEFKKFLDYAENPTRKFAKRAIYEQAYRRSNSVSMAYDRMTVSERNTVARGLWFYPWTKAATSYLGHTLVEHPTGSSVALAQGKQAETEQHRAWGNIPSLAYGMMPVNGGKESAQPGYLMPFQTGGQAIESLTHPFDILQSNANPVYAAGLAGMGAGRPSNPVLGDTAGAKAVSALLGSSPEWRTIADAINPSYAAKKTHLFPHNWLDDIFTSFLGGPPFPRKTNGKTLNFYGNIEHGKLKPHTIYTKH